MPFLNRLQEGSDISILKFCDDGPSDHTETVLISGGIRARCPIEDAVKPTAESVIVMLASTFMLIMITPDSNTYISEDDFQLCHLVAKPKVSVVLKSN